MALAVFRRRASEEQDPLPESNVTAEQLAAESGQSLERATRVLRVAVRAVGDYAPDAPLDLKDEAVLRFGAYLLTMETGNLRKHTVGPYDHEWVTNHAPAFRNCGAAMLLTRYRVRRGGAI